jgi:uncharacterized RDD family membrane protein YckC
VDADSEDRGAVARERVITGEAVELELPIARLGTRTAAIVVDAVVELFLAGVVLTAIGYMSAAFEFDEALTIAFITMGTVLVFLIWPVTFETLSRGRSPGKFAMGLRVVRDDGGPIRFRHAMVRGLVGLVIEWPGLPLMPLTWIFTIWATLLNPKGKRIGDLAAGTMVLQERLPDRGRYVAAMPPPLAAWAATLDLTRVDDALALTVRQFLSRAHELREGPRAGLGQQLVNQVMAVTAPPPPAGTSGWWYLAAVLAERRRRHEQRLATQRPLVTLGASNVQLPMPATAPSSVPGHGPVPGHAPAPGYAPGPGSAPAPGYAASPGAASAPGPAPGQMPEDFPPPSPAPQPAPTGYTPPA